MLGVKRKILLYSLAGFFSLLYIVGTVQPAAAVAENCYWTASTSQDMSANANWAKVGGGTCTLDSADSLFFGPDATGLVDTPTSTSATWDVALGPVASVTVSSTYPGTITINSATAGTSGDFIQRAGTITNNSSNLAIAGTLAVVAGTFTNSTTAQLTITLDLNIESATFTDGGTTIVGRDFISVASTYTRSAGSLSVSRDFTNQGTFTDTGGVVYASSTTATVYGFGNTGTSTFSTLIINGTNKTIGPTGSGPFSASNITFQNNGAATTTGGITVSNALTINSGSTLNASTTAFTLSNAGGTPFVNNGTFNANASTVTYAGAAPTVASTTFYNLAIGSTNAVMDGNVTTTNHLNIAPGKSLNLAGNSAVVGGNLAIGGQITQTAGTVTMTGASATLGGAGITTLYNLTISGTAITLAGNVTTTNNITVDSGKTLALSTYNLNLGGNLVNSGTVTQAASGVTSMTGTGKTIGGSGSTQVYALTASNSNTITLGGEVTVSSTLTVGSGATLALAGNGLTAGAAINNSGTITQTASSTILSGTANFGGSGSTQVFALTVNNSNTVTLAGEVTASSTITVGSGATLALAGNGLTAGAAVNNSGTVTQTASSTILIGTANFGGSGLTTVYNLTVRGTTVTLAGNVTTTNILTIDASKTLNASSRTVVLSKSSGIPLINNGTFTASTSVVNYTGTGAITVASTTFSTLTLGAGTYTFDGDTTSTVAFTNGGTTTIASGKNLVASGTIDNNGTITETGAIKHALASAKLTDSAGTEVSSYGTSGDTLYVTVVDTDGNLNVGSADTITGSVVTANDGTSDTESITLTETGVDTSVFRGSIAFTPSAMKTNSNSKLEVNGAGSLSLAFTDSKDSSDTGSDTASYTGSSIGSGGGGGGGGGDTTPPSNTSIVIAGGSASTLSTAVALTLGATDASSMMISNTSDFAGASWETYSTTKSWTLTSGAGTKTVYAKFRDSNNNVSTAVSDTITLTGATIATSTTPATTESTATPATSQTTVSSQSTAGTASSATASTASTGGSSAITETTVKTKYKFTKQLSVGSKGTEVKNLQTMLKELGYFTYPTITGYYGSATKAAVVKFQKAKKLAPYPGWVGPGTRKALNSL